MTDEELAAIDMRYGSRSVPPWQIRSTLDGLWHTVKSNGGNEIIAIRHYSAGISGAIAEVVMHCHEDVAALLAEVRTLRACQQRLGQYLDEDRILYPTREGETIAALRQRVADLTEVAQDAYKHLPYGGTRDWVGAVLGLRVAVPDRCEGSKFSAWIGRWTQR